MALFILMKLMLMLNLIYIIVVNCFFAIICLFSYGRVTDNISLNSLDHNGMGLNMNEQ